MLAADLSTIFLIIAVHFFMIVLFNRSFLLYILLFLFILGIVIVVTAAKKKARFSSAKSYVVTGAYASSFLRYCMWRFTSMGLSIVWF